MGVQHGCVERGYEKIKICEHNGHGAVDDAVGAIDEAFRLVREPGRVRREGQWGKSDSTVSFDNDAAESRERTSS